MAEFTDKGTLKRDPNAPKTEAAATPEERAKRIAEARARALAAKAAGGSRQAAPQAPPMLDVDAPSDVDAAPPSAGFVDDRPRTLKGTLKRDPDAPKTEPAATPEERAARVADARVKAIAARDERVAAGLPTQPNPKERVLGGGAPAGATGAALAGGPVLAAAAGGPPSDGLLRTAKGTIKRDPNAPKTEPAATPEERARRITEAKAKAAAAAAARAAGGAQAAVPAAGGGGAAGQVARATPGMDADRAERMRIFGIVTKGVPGAEPVLRPVVTGRAERPPPRAEFTLSEQMEDIANLLRRDVPEADFEVMTSPLDVVVQVDRRHLHQVLERCLRNSQLDMRFLRMVTAVDLMEEGLEVVYALKSLTTARSAIVKTLVPAHDPVVPSASDLWPAANWHERETREMFGVEFAGHPDPRNLLLDEDMTIHPLLKAHPLAEVELKQGVSTF